MKIQYEGKNIKVEEGVRLCDVLAEQISNSAYPVIGATFNNEYIHLGRKIVEDGTVKLIDISSKEGTKIYRRTLVYILAMAFEKIFKDKKLMVKYQLSNSMFCEIENTDITEEMIEQLTAEMKKIVKKNIDIEQVIMNREEATKLYEDKDSSKGRLQLDLETNKEIYMYFCGEYYNYCYGSLAHKSGITKVFEIVKYGSGFLIRYPGSSAPLELPKFVETKKIAWALDEYEDIHRILNMHTVFRLNSAVEQSKIKEVIMIEEALHEKKIANIADEVAKKREVKVVLIAGPSSSGKTTFAQRLGIQLRINGLKPVTISVDNYFVERENNPKDENGNYDFECIEALDLELFNDHLTRLLDGEEIEMPEFNFKLGTKEYKGKKLKLAEDEILVIEGIHCLNDKLTNSIDKSRKYKIYISALTVLNMDRYNRISTTDTRLVRRIVRDNQFRSYDAKQTIKTWYSVNRGEERNIFPFQEEANIIFNTSLIYELGVLKDYAIPLLEKIGKENEEHAEAQRLINTLRYFKSIPGTYVPSHSLLKEFIGGGDFDH